MALSNRGRAYDSSAECFFVSRVPLRLLRFLLLLWHGPFQRGGGGRGRRPKQRSPFDVRPCVLDNFVVHVDRVDGSSSSSSSGGGGSSGGLSLRRCLVRVHRLLPHIA